MAKIGGFIGTVAAGAALVAAAAGGTGAYFTDSKAGEMKASTGQLKLNTTETNLSFADLMPGTSKTNSIDYNVVTTGPSDVWLVFDPADASYQKFTGAKLNALAPKGGLGRYGHFAVSNNTGGPLFQSYNLAHAPVDAIAASKCAVNVNGHGGSAQQAVSVEDTPPWCGVPSAILIAAGLTNGQGGTANLTFGVTGRWTVQEIAPGSVKFKLVATQAGHRPDAANF